MNKPKCKYKIEPISALNLVTDRQKQILEMRLGMGNYDRCHSLREIGEKLPRRSDIMPDKPIDPERIRQIDAKALRKLRHPLRNCKVLMNGWDY